MEEPKGTDKKSEIMITTNAIYPADHSGIIPKEAGSVVSVVGKDTVSNRDLLKPKVPIRKRKN